MSKKATTKNFEKVLKNISKAFSESDKDEKKIWADWLNKSLNDLRDDDFFGTEGQLDPRNNDEIERIEDTEMSFIVPKSSKTSKNSMTVTLKISLTKEEESVLKKFKEIEELESTDLDTVEEDWMEGLIEKDLVSSILGEQFYITKLGKEYLKKLS